MIINGQQNLQYSHHIHPNKECNGLYTPHQEKDHHIGAAEKKKKIEA